ncbi:hypothetical protein CLV78_11924 [Aliiruegeria haliotis]|uniref:Uncharacterized protein n=1 Tax=Aliiruegeria haliotis TaxID=1280846 RepID=A0A2T0REX6_9RHOB|nr:hypothetical protein [Aliiruegeria haliotis]PRY19692.1 hypothetical protein CLV78_11924 [Aliiruegeria haliotis]
MTDTATKENETDSGIDTDAVLKDLEAGMDNNPVKSLDGAAESGLSTELPEELPSDILEPDSKLLLPGSSETDIDSDTVLKELENSMDEHPVRPIDSNNGQVQPEGSFVPNDLLDAPGSNVENDGDLGGDQSAIEVDAPAFTLARHVVAAPEAAHGSITVASPGPEFMAPGELVPMGEIDVLSTVLAVVLLNMVVPAFPAKLPEFETTGSRCSGAPDQYNRNS